MKYFKRSLLALAAVITAPICADAATILRDPFPYWPEVSLVTVEGTINPGDYQTFIIQLVQAKMAHSDVMVLLNSDGGSVVDGMLMGIAVRQANAMTGVPKGSGCWSSCALIWAGGVQRLTEGPVLFHHPYFMDGSILRPIEDKSELDKVNQYWLEMGLSQESFDKSMQHGPYEMFQIAGPGMIAPPLQNETIVKKTSDAVVTMADAPQKKKKVKSDSSFKNGRRYPTD